MAAQERKLATILAMLAKLFFEGLTPKKSNSRFTYGANRILSMELGT